MTKKEITEYNLKELKSAYKKWLYLKEHYTFEAPLDAVLSNFTKQDKDIFVIIGKSGGTKTEIIRAFGQKKNKYIYPTSSITSRTLISGHPGKEYDLVSKLKGRVITIQDFTSILSKPSSEISQIFGDLRLLTDGYMDKDFGTGVRKTYKPRSSVLTGSTGAIESNSSVHTELGQRLIFFKPDGGDSLDDSMNLMDKVLDNADKKKEMRIELHEVTLGFVNKTIQDRLEGGKIDLRNVITEKAEKELKPAALFVATARTYVKRSGRGTIDTFEIEAPTRLYNSIIKLTAVHALAHGRDKTSKKDIKFGLRVLHDNIPTKRLLALKLLSNGDSYTTTELAEKYNLPNPSVQNILEELYVLEIIDKKYRTEQGKKYIDWSWKYPEEKLKDKKVINIK